MAEEGQNRKSALKSVGSVAAANPVHTNLQQCKKDTHKMEAYPQ